MQASGDFNAWWIEEGSGQREGPRCPWAVCLSRFCNAATYFLWWLDEFHGLALMPQEIEIEVWSFSFPLTDWLITVFWGSYWILTAFLCLKMHEHAGWPQLLSSEIINEIVRQTQIPTAVKLAFHVLVDPVSKTAVEWGLPSLIWLAFSISTTVGLLQVRRFSASSSVHIYVAICRHMSPLSWSSHGFPTLKVRDSSRPRSPPPPWHPASVAHGCFWASGPWASFFGLPQGSGGTWLNFRCPENGCWRESQKCELHVTPIFWFENVM